MEYNPNPNTPRGVDPVLCWGHPRVQKQSGIYTYRLSSNAQRPLAGALHNAIFNTSRRCMGQFLYVVPPFVAAAWMLKWAEERNHFLNSKEGRREEAGGT